MKFVHNCKKQLGRSWRSLKRGKRGKVILLLPVPLANSKKKKKNLCLESPVQYWAFLYHESLTKKCSAVRIDFFRSPLAVASEGHVGLQHTWPLELWQLRSPRPSFPLFLRAHITKLSCCSSARSPSPPCPPPLFPCRARNYASSCI